MKRSELNQLVEKLVKQAIQESPMYDTGIPRDRIKVFKDISNYINSKLEQSALPPEELDIVINKLIRLLIDMRK